MIQKRKSLPTDDRLGDRLIKSAKEILALKKNDVKWERRF